MEMIEHDIIVDLKQHPLWNEGKGNENKRDISSGFTWKQFHRDFEEDQLLSMLREFHDNHDFQLDQHKSPRKYSEWQKILLFFQIQD